MNSLMLCIKQFEPEYQVLAANLLLHLDTLVSRTNIIKLCRNLTQHTLLLTANEYVQDNSTCKSIFREEAVLVLLKSVASEESCGAQQLSAFIISNLGGTYSWTGEPYTIGWLVKKACLTSSYQRNMIKNICWSDDCLEVRLELECVII